MGAQLTPEIECISDLHKIIGNVEHNCGIML